MIAWGVVAFCAVLLCVAGGWVILLRRACNRRLVSQACGRSQGVGANIGISVLCCGLTDLVRIERLLSVDYARYEVVVVLDGRQWAEDFERLIARYHMIRVEWQPTDELHTEGVRSLGRSRKRCFRRLVVVDRIGGDPHGDLDAAAAVASYDYLIPLCGDLNLLPETIERIAEVLGEEPERMLEWISSPVGAYGCVISREAVVAAGGFGRGVLRGIPRSKRRLLWEPLLAREACHRIGQGWIRAVGLLFAGAAVACAVAGVWAWSAISVTLLALWLAARCARSCVDRSVGK